MLVEGCCHVVNAVSCFQLPLAYIDGAETACRASEKSGAIRYPSTWLKYCVHVISYQYGVVLMWTCKCVEQGVESGLGPTAIDLSCGRLSCTDSGFPCRPGAVMEIYPAVAVALSMCTSAEVLITTSHRCACQTRMGHFCCQQMTTYNSYLLTAENKDLATTTGFTYSTTHRRSHPWLVEHWFVQRYSCV
jgi:hypothetical protein